jgi:hypothetical protein
VWLTCKPWMRRCLVELPACHCRQTQSESVVPRAGRRGLTQQSDIAPADVERWQQERCDQSHQRFCQDSDYEPLDSQHPGLHDAYQSQLKYVVCAGRAGGKGGL